MQYRAFIITHLSPTILRKRFYHFYVNHSIRLADQPGFTLKIQYWVLIITHLSPTLSRELLISFCIKAEKEYRQGNKYSQQIKWGRGK